MRGGLLGLICLTALSAVIQPQANAAVVLASDDYESGTGVGYGGTSGTGFGPHTDFSGSGGIFWQNTVGPKIDGNGSLGSYSNGTSESWGRTFTNTSAFGADYPLASFDISMRFNIPNSNSSLKGFNLKSALGSGFGDNELISVGLTSASNTGLLITGSGGPQTLDLGTELRGPIIDVNVFWNTVTGAFTVTASVRSQAPISMVGTLQNPGSFIPGAAGFIHSDAGGGGNDIMFDNLKLTAVPEVSQLLAIPSVALLVGSCLAICRWRANRAAVTVAA